MESVIIVLLTGVANLAVAAFGGSSNPELTAVPTATAVPTDTPPLTATSAPTLTTEPAANVSLGESVAVCLEGSIGADGAEAALSNLVESTTEQKAALIKGLLLALQRNWENLWHRLLNLV